jgi:hypothetical protein
MEKRRAHLSFGPIACGVMPLVRIKGEQPNSNAEEPPAILLTIEQMPLPLIAQQ